MNTDKLIEKGYEQDGLSYDGKEEAKNRAKELRDLGYRATVREFSRRGVYYYSVWKKRK